MKKILIIDDDHLYTEGIENSLSAHFNITSVHTFNAIQAALATSAYDVALLDMQLHDGSNGLQSINLLRTANVKIIIVSNTATKEQLRVSLMMGVNGYVHKASTHKDVKQAIEKVLADRTAFTDKFFESDPIILKSTPLKLSDRQWSLLIHFICDPLIGNKAIGQAMGITEGWAKSSMSALFGVFDVRNKHQLYAELGKRGMIPKITPHMAQQALQDHRPMEQ